VYSGATGNYLARVGSPDGYVMFGPANTSWAHFITDRPSFYFNTTVTANGNINTYNGAVSISGAGSSYFNGGNVGIGTTAPGYPLTVTGRIASGAAGTGGIWVDGGGSQFVGSYDSIRLGLYSGGWNLILQNNGYVGIGTTSPAYKLEVVGDIRANGAWLRTAGNTGWYSDTYGGGWYMQDTTWIRSYGSKPVYMDTGFDTSGASGVSCGGGLGGGYNFQVCGTAKVTSTLTVTGNISTSGTVTASGARPLYVCPSAQSGSCSTNCLAQVSTTQTTCTYKVDVNSNCNTRSTTLNCPLIGRILEP
jgi:hypothetical protein